MPSVIRWKLITNRRVWAPMISFPVIALYMGRLMTHLNRQLTKLFTPPDSQEGFLTRCHFSFPFYSCSVMWLWKNKNNCLRRELCKVGELRLKLHLFLLVNYKSAQLQWKYSKSAFPVFFFFLTRTVLLNIFCESSCFSVRLFLPFARIWASQTNLS